MEKMKNLINFIYFRIKTKGIRDKLQFYPPLTIETVKDFTFEELNIIIELQNEIYNLKP